MAQLHLKPALRRVAKEPGFAVFAATILALGVALSTAAFSITNTALLRPLPFRDPEQLVRVSTATPQGLNPAVAPGNAIDVRDSLGDLGEFGLFTIEQKNIGEPGQPPEPLYGFEASADVLRLLGARAELGRIFLPGEDKPRRPPVMMLTHGYWRERFGGDPSVIGKVLRVETTDFTVVGVLSPEFDEPALWYGCKWVTCFTIWPNWRTIRSNKWMSVMGRLKPGVTLDFAQARIGGFSRQLALEYPAIGSDLLRVAPLGTSFAGAQLRFTYWLVVGLALFVLLIACANLGAVQLARAFARQRELSIRAALGATRADLTAALAIENTLVAVAGTLLGLLGSFWMRSLVCRWLSEPTAAFDGRVFVFAATTGLIACAVFGFLPAWLSARNIASALNESSPGSTLGRSHSRARNALIVTQLGLALILVSTAASFVLGVRSFLHRDRGWRPEQLVSGGFHVPGSWTKREAENPSLSRIVEEKLRSIPGVQQVATTSGLPLYDVLDSTQSIYVEGAAPAKLGGELKTTVCSVSPSFFETLGLPLREGRLFEEWRKSDPLPVIVSAKTAQLLWPPSSALGKRIRLGERPEWLEVVGVVADASFSNSYATPGTSLQVYQPVQNAPSVWYMFILKSGVTGAALEHSIRASFHELDPDIMVVGVGDTLRMLENDAAMRPFSVSLITFAAAGLIIAMIGLYAVMDQFTRQRQREIGVRIALGAERAHILKLMLGRAARMLGIGGLAGILGAMVVSLLFHRAMPELPMFGIVGESLVALGLFCVGVAACYAPSSRAARVNPVEVLRGE